jgi:Tfp pilus assembly protein PilF
MRFIVFIFIFFIFSNSFSQSTSNAKAMKLYGKALAQIADGNLKEAIETLTKSINTDNNFIDAYLSLAGVYGEKKEYSNAIANYEIAFSKDSNYTNIYKLPYSINLAGAGKFDEALQALNIFLSIPNLSSKSIGAAQYRKRNCEFEID